MRKFVLGLIVGAALAIVGYKPYQIETEYLHNSAAELVPGSSPCVVLSGLSKAADSERRDSTVRIVKSANRLNAANKI